MGHNTNEANWTIGSINGPKHVSAAFFNRTTHITRSLFIIILRIVASKLQSRTMQTFLKTLVRFLASRIPEKKAI
jgi:hypothetical protein